MQDLTLIGVHGDGEHIVVQAGDGRRFRLRVDEALRAAVRADRPRLGQLQIQTDARMRPRDIQARIRSGQSAEDVAAESGLPLAHIRRYDTPVMYERAHVARLAQATAVRRIGGEPPAPLGEIVAESLTGLGCDPEQVTWDAWRPEEGPWTVQAAFTRAGEPCRATWSFDHHSRHLAPTNGEARGLIDGSPVPEAAPAPPSAAPGPRRLAPVRDMTIDLRGASPAVHPSIASRTEPDAPAEPVSAPAAEVPEPQEQPVLPAATAVPPAGPGTDPTVELLENLRERRGRRTRPVAPEDEDATSSDPLEDLLGSLMSRPVAEASSSEALHDPGPNHPARRGGARGEEPDEVVSGPRTDDAMRRKPIKVGKAARSKAAQASAQASLPAPEIAAASGTSDALPKAAGGERGARNKARRASVPSWDDIVFGSRRD